VPASALALALTAALVHALWNLLLARSADVWAATAVAAAAGVLVALPGAGLTWEVEASAWPYVAGSAGLELAYLTLLAAAYRRADLSVVYPLARGVAPVLVLVTAVLALGAGTSPGQAAGVVGVAAGVLLVRGPGGEARVADVGLALTVAACIAGYTLVDNAGIDHASALTYLLLVLLPAAVALPLAVAATRGPGALAAQVRPAALAVGAGMVGAYALVLLALRLAPAAPVAAVRETSIVIGVALAAPLLHEPVGRRRLVGAGIVTAGVVLIGAS
jgi:drug/metabolite transporter (DMT)-like permease